MLVKIIKSDCLCTTIKDDAVFFIFEKNYSMIVFTLDAGGTNFVFSIVEDGKINPKKIHKPANGDNLEKCLKNIISGFEELATINNKKPDAISFAFPGPADFKNGIIGDLHNLPGFRGGVALGKMIELWFKVPVFINNDGDLYAYGEAMGGTLPFINNLLKNSGSNKSYSNITGMTLGTGFGAGIVSNGELLQGDNMCAAEIWITSNRANPEYNSEEGISIRAVKYFFSKFSEIPFSDCPEPKEIYFMATDENNKYSIAAQKAFYELGRYLGDAIANIITLTDGIVVIGGGIAGAKEFIIPGINHELNREFKKLDGRTNKRLTHKVFCLNYERELKDFLQDDKKLISVPYFENIKIEYYHIPKSAYMFSNFDTSEMISLGAYFFAVKQLKKQNT